MGKNSKLRRIFGISRRKSSSPNLDKKLSLPKLLQKSPAPPNAYFRDGKELEDEIVQLKPGPSGNDVPPKSPKRKNLQNYDSDSHANVIKHPAQASVHQDAVPVGMKEAKRPTAEEANMDTTTNDLPLVVDSGEDSLTTNDAMQMEVNPVLSFHQSNEESPLPRSTSANTPMYQKEFPPSRNVHTRHNSSKKSHEFGSNAGDAPEETCGDEKRRNLAPPAAHEWNASGACRVTASSFTPVGSSSSVTQPDCSCNQCRPPVGPVKDCDWGWFTSVSTSPAKVTRNAQQPGTSSVVSCSFKVSAFPTANHTQQRYVNDEQRPPVFHFGAGSGGFEMTASRIHTSTEYHQQETIREISFTITEGNGRVTQFSISNPEWRQNLQLQSHANCHGLSGMTSCHASKRTDVQCEQPTTHYADRTWYQGEDSVLPTGSDSCPVIGSNSASTSRVDCVKMTPSLSSRPQESKTKRQMAVPKERVRNEEAPHRYEGRKESPKPRQHRATQKSSPHFELSMASYSKLIAYCDTNKLLIRSSNGERKSVSGDERLNRQNTNPNQASERDNVANGISTAQPSAARPSNNTEKVNDLCRLARVLETVEECSWYWGAISGNDSKDLLRDSSPGTFLLRDSSDPRYLFSLSVKTRQGPTSIRIVYNDGAFRFDSEMDDVTAGRQGDQQNNRSGHRSGHPNYVKRIAPVFTCVINMILSYTNHLGLVRPHSKKAMTSQAAQQKKTECERCGTGAATSSTDPQSRERAEQFMCYWVNRSGRQEIPVLLSTPRTQGFPSLQRLCRQTLSSSQKLWLDKSVVDKYPLPNSLKKYIKKYPYPI